MKIKIAKITLPYEKLKKWCKYLMNKRTGRPTYDESVQCKERDKINRLKEQETNRISIKFELRMTISEIAEQHKLEQIIGESTQSTSSIMSLGCFLRYEYSFIVFTRLAQTF